MRLTIVKALKSYLKGHIDKHIANVTNILFKLEKQHNKRLFRTLMLELVL